MSGGLLEQELFDEAEIGLGVDSDGVVVRGLDVQVQAVFEEAELLEAFGALEPACRQGREEVERSLAIGVEADVLPVEGWWFKSRRRSFDSTRLHPSEQARWGPRLRAPLRMTISYCVAVVWDGGAGEVEGAAVGGGNDFYGVWVGDVLGRAADFERG